MRIHVIGSGVSGLSTAVRLLESGHQVAVQAKDYVEHTVSWVAAALWHPFRAEPQELVTRLSGASYQEFQRLANNPESGIRVQRCFELFPTTVPDAWWKAAVEGHYRRVAASECPSGLVDGYVFDSPMIETPLYLKFLERRVRSLGGRIEHHSFLTLDDALGDADAVVNCTGLGARMLANDRSMFAIRGQVVRVAQVGLTDMYLDEHREHGITYIIPRSQDIILGGTTEDGDEDRTIRPETANHILKHAVALCPALAGADVLEHKVGLRPGRPTLRLEVEAHPSRKLLVHNYGHGGAGLTLSWGCADEVVRLVNTHAR